MRRAYWSVLVDYQIVKIFNNNYEKIIGSFVIMFCCIAAGVIIDQSVFAESEKNAQPRKIQINQIVLQ